MTNFMDQPKSEKPSTYVVQNRSSEKELRRLTVQDRTVTVSMGGVLPEQPDPMSIYSVLDVGCGTGGWMIEAARCYPHMSLVGIDISKRMIDYARAQAEDAQVAARVEFRTMDALQMLEFRGNTFDLVNLRFGSSFVRKFEWRKILEEMLQVARPGGIVRVVETEAATQSTSKALEEFCDMLARALSQAMHLFEPKPDGLTSHLPELLELHGYGCEQIQKRVQTLEFRAGTPEGQGYCEDMQYLMQTLRPFIEKHGCLRENYDAICQQAREDMQRPDFRAVWQVMTVWGKKPEKIEEVE